MSRILLISLPVLALLGCGDSKKEKALPSENTTVAPPPATPNTLETIDADTKNDVPSIATPTGGSSQNPGNGKDTPVQNPADEGKGSSAECEVRVLDFDKKPDGQALSLGDKIREQYQAWGVHVEAERKGSNERGEAIIFDSAARPDQATKDAYKRSSERTKNGDGFDADLTTDENRNVLIIAENTYDDYPNDGFDRVTYPDDNANGGKIRLVFDRDTRVIDMDFVANGGDKSEVKLFKNANDSQSFHAQAIPKADPNVVTKLTVGSNAYARKLKIILTSGGAVDNIKICVKK